VTDQRRRVHRARAEWPPWRIRNQPCSAIDQWPELAVECDERWAKILADLPETTTIGEGGKMLDALAIEIMTTAGVLSPQNATKEN